jgi:hypothetical protein
VRFLALREIPTVGGNLSSWPAVLRTVRPRIARAADIKLMEAAMHGLIYLIGLIVVIMAILSFFGLR